MRAFVRPMLVAGRPRSSSTALRAALALAVVVACAAVLPLPAAAQQPGPDGIDIAVEAGYDGRYQVGRRVPVTVTIEADRLVRGVIEVTVDGAAGSWSTPVEVPGGSDKSVVVVVPTPSGFAVRDLRVRLLGSGEAAVVDAEVEPVGADELVGLLPDVTPADLPGAFAFPHGIGTAHFAEVTPDHLALAGSIDPLGTLVVGPEELGRLDATARALVLDWVDRGGRLVVDAAPGTPVAGLPDEWQPASGRVVAGLGEVRTSGGRAAAGAWAEVLEPTPTVATADLLQFGFFESFGVEPMSSALARDAGIDSLDLPWLLGFLAAYVVLAGPVAYLVLRRFSPGLGWVVVPALAVAFTGGAFVVGSDLRSGTTAAHGTAFETSPAGTRATTIIGAVSRSGGDTTVRFPAGWSSGRVEEVNDFGFGGVSTDVAEVAVSTGAAGSEARMPLAAGGFGVLHGSGPVTEAPGGLTLESRSEGVAVVGTVRNDGAVTLEQVGVFLGRAGERVGDLEPGETAEFRFEGSEFRLGDPFFPPEAGVWPGPSGFNDGRPEVDSSVNLALLGQVSAALGPNARPRGVVTAVGWTRQLGPPDAVGADDAAGRSAVIGRSPVAGGPTLSRGAAHREVLRGPDAVEVDDLPRSVQGLVWRFAMPAGTGAVPLIVDVPGYIVRLDVWDGSTWQTVHELGDPNAFGDPSAVRSMPLPDGVRITDTVLFRGFVNTDFGGLMTDGLDLHSGAA